MNNNDLAPFYFHQGTNYHAYEYLGCTSYVSNDKRIYLFRTWAPNATMVGLVSDFSGWDDPLYLTRITDGGLWELKYESECSIEGKAYKFLVVNGDTLRYKGDPYAKFSKGYSDGASIVYTFSSFNWTDGRWLASRRDRISAFGESFLATPINIYEMHLGSFLRHGDGTYYSYRELAEVLPTYLKRMGYTHVEFLPIQEHPFDGSWGYQVCAFYAPTSRFGSPDDLKHLINALHTSGIGVILDWVPAHFPKDEWGLYEFDGTPLYEYQGRDRQESRSWGTRYFDLGREEVQSFLVSNALYFLREYHVDGLRVDAVASMIYLDYDRMPGEWIPNQYGGKENLEALAFLKKLNSAIFNEFSDVLMIAEESTAFRGITAPVKDGGIGFNLKWNMGWANDFYDYLSTDPLFRKEKHKALNFPLMYAFNENFVLPISHDEVVHGKKSFIDKMFGTYEAKFAQARCAAMLQMTYPGKKLTFMGTEYAQFREWAYDQSLEWFMLDYPMHKSYRDYIAELNDFYLSHSELWDFDFSERGFSWLDADAAEKNSVFFKRINRDGEELHVIINFSGAEQAFHICSPDIEPLFKTDLFECRIERNKDGAVISVPGFSGIIYREKNNNFKIKFKGDIECTVKRNV